MVSIWYWVEATIVGVSLGIWLDAPWYGTSALIGVCFWLTMMSAAALRFVLSFNALAQAIRISHASETDQS